MPTALEAIDAFLAMYRAGKVRSLKGGFAPFDRKRAAVIRSHWTDTFEYIAEFYDLGVPPGSVPVAHYSRRLEELARRAARASSASANYANNAASVARLVFLNVFGHMPRAGTGRRDVTALPEGWRAGYFALEKRRNELRAADDSSWRSVDKSLGYYAAAASLAAFHGHRHPKDAPRDVNTWREWAKLDGLTNSATEHHVTGLNAAGAALGLPAHWPRIESNKVLRSRSVRNIPDLTDKLRRADEERPAASLSTLDILKALYPYLHSDALAYLKTAEGRKRGTWRKKRIEFLGRLAFALDALAFPRDGDAVDTYTMDVPAAFAPRDEEARLSKRGLAGDSSERRASYARALLDLMGRASVRFSPLRVADGSGGDLPFYTDMVRDEMEWLWDMTVAASERRMKELGTEEERGLWMRVVEEVSSIRRQIAAHNDGKNLLGRIDTERLISLISLGQAWFMGLPALRAEAHRARERWTTAGSPTQGEVYTTYERWCCMWVAALLALTDSMRPKNYAGALLNKHILPVWDRRTKRVVGLSTSWTGIGDEESVTTKKTWADATQTSPNSRTYRLPQALLDSVLLSDFVMLIRPVRLVACSAIPSIDAHDPVTDQHAFFVSDESERKGDGKHCPISGVTGRYSRPDGYSDLVGKALHWMIVEVLRRPDIPAWGAELREQFRGLFAGHRPARHLAAGFWGFEADDWAWACWITNDSLGTLKRHYARRRGSLDPHAEALKSIVDRHAHFVKVAKHVRDGGLIDWESFDPERPERAMRPADWSPSRSAGRAA